MQAPIKLAALSALVLGAAAALVFVVHANTASDSSADIRPPTNTFPNRSQSFRQGTSSHGEWNPRDS